MLRLEINYREEKCKKHKYMETKQCYLMINGSLKKSKRKKKYLDMNDNKNMTTQNLWGTAKAVLRGKFTAIQSYLKKQE